MKNKLEIIQSSKRTCNKTKELKYFKILSVILEEKEKVGGDLERNLVTQIDDECGHLFVRRPQTKRALKIRVYYRRTLFRNSTAQKLRAKWNKWKRIGDKMRPNEQQNHTSTSLRSSEFSSVFFCRHLWLWVKMVEEPRIESYK